MLFAANTLWKSGVLFVGIILELPESIARFYGVAEKSAKLGAARFEIQLMEKEGDSNIK